MKKYIYTFGISIGLIFFTSVSNSFASESIIYRGANGHLYLKSFSDTLDGTQITSLPYSEFQPASSKPDGKDIVFVDSYSGNKLRKKSASDTDNGTLINSVSSLDPVYSPDGAYIVYTNVSDGNKCYKKSSADTGNGTAITSIGCYSPQYSPDGAYIVFGRVGGYNDVYKKNANDALDGTIIITNWKQNSNGSIKYSPDGLYIYYQNTAGKISKKTVSVAGNGTEINTDLISSLAVSNDGQYIVYGNTTNSGKMYKKSSTDTSNGTAITTQAAQFITFVSVNPANCTDGVKNQDETSIDYGGVCGTCSDGIQQTDVTNPEIAIDYGGRCTSSDKYRFDGCTQRTIKYYGSGASSVYNMGGLSNYSLTIADVSSESEWLRIFGFGQSKIEQWTFDDGTGLNYDLFKVYNIQYSDSSAEYSNPQVLSGSLTVTSGGPVSKIRTDTTTGTPPAIEIYSMRSGVVRKFDFVRFTGASYPTITKGSQSNYAGSVTWSTQKGIVSSPLVLSGGIATAYLSDGLLADSAVVNLQQMNSKFAGVYFQFSGFSFGLAGGSLSVTECGNGDFKCKMYIDSPTGLPTCKPDSNSVLGIGDACVYTTGFTTPVVINDAGDITTVSGNACIPNRKQGTIVTPDGFEVDYVVDQSGAVIQQNTKPIATGDFTESCLSNNPGILEYVKCSFQFVGNKVKQLTTTTEKTTDIINKAQTGVKPNETKSGSIELGQSGKQNTNNSLLNAVQNQYIAYDTGTDSFANVGTMMKWVLGAVLTFVVILLFFALARNRKS